MFVKGTTRCWKIIECPKINCCLFYMYSALSTPYNDVRFTNFVVCTTSDSTYLIERCSKYWEPAGSNPSLFLNVSAMACWAGVPWTGTDSRTSWSRPGRCRTAPECRHRPAYRNIGPPPPPSSDLGTREDIRGLFDFGKIWCCACPLPTSIGWVSIRQTPMHQGHGQIFLYSRCTVVH